MSADQPSLSQGSGTPAPANASPRLARLRRLWWALAVVAGGAVGGGFALVHASGRAASPRLGPVPTRPDATWAAGARRAPGFRLRDQNGRPVSLASFRGRPVIVTFIDPLCRNLCPLEAKVLNDVESRFASTARPQIVAVSVNPWGDARSRLVQDVRKWHLTPQWRWAVGGSSQLASVWRRYQVAVRVEKKTIAGVTVREISHVEAAFLVDPAGYQRALYLYPFAASDVARTVQQLARAHSA
jgi:cytochrome oxidase Cu insertion factor (SCO1/SenC/PrrC family)